MMAILRILSIEGTLSRAGGPRILRRKPVESTPGRHDPFPSSHALLRKGATLDTMKHWEIISDNPQQSRLELGLRLSRGLSRANKQHIAWIHRLGKLLERVKQIEKNWGCRRPSFGPFCSLARTDAFAVTRRCASKTENAAWRRSAASPCVIEVDMQRVRECPCPHRSLC
jgi:hypothetical protein